MALEVEQHHGQARADQRHDRARHARQEAAAEQDDGEGRAADRQGDGVGAAELGQRVQKLLERGLAGSLDAQHLGQLRDRHHDGEPVHEAHDDRLAEEVGDEAQPQQAGQQAQHARHDAEPRREQRQPPGIAQRQRRHRDGDDGRHRGVGADDEQARAAEQGVGDQRQHAAIEAGQRQAGELAVDEAHRHHHRPQGQARREVVRQERCLVGFQCRQAGGPARELHAASRVLRRAAG